MPTESDSPGMWACLVRWWRGEWYGPDRMAPEFDPPRHWFVSSDRISLILAIVMLVGFGLPTTYVELLGFPALGWWLWRLWRVWPTILPLVLQPLVVLLAAWTLWSMVSISWSPDARMGWKQWHALRWAWVPLVLWPVLYRRSILVGALMVGLIMGNLGQALHAVGKALGISALVWPRLADRNSGWWDPVVGGSMLCAALGLHIGLVVGGRGALRVLGVGGVVVTCIGIAATGSRGAYLTAGALLVFALITLAVQAFGRSDRGRTELGVVIATAVLLVGLGVGTALLSGTITRRFEAAKQEISAALRDGKYDTDTGARILMAKLATEAFLEHPVRGVGYGGYRKWCETTMRARTGDPAWNLAHAHAHNTYLHIAATGGIVGLVIAGVITVRGVLNAVALGKRREGGSFAWSPLWAMGAFLMVGLFDPIHINAQTSAQLAALLGLCPSWIVARKAGPGM